MKLKQIVCDKTDLILTKEKKTIGYGKEFTIDDEARAMEILAATFKGKPVAELVEEPVDNTAEQEGTPEGTAEGTAEQEDTAENTAEQDEEKKKTSKKK